ncbi:helix-turn-helix domain-containing protein [Cohnella zeiphila]|uniref:Helix-turn-helix domain-containing protein n=1 Tax=Cohnella zeiphila TaxID=2761120 RepID=A0A7X0STD9_9BACL|nr:helix-turn-helix domain-containing protein [Cohnella zeiphila]
MHVSERLYPDEVLLELARDRLFRELLTSEEPGWPERLFGMKLWKSFAFPTLAVMEPAGVAGEEGERRRYAAKIGEELRKYAEESGAVFLDEEGRVGLLFSWVSKEALEELHGRMSCRFAHPINLGVGLPCNRLSELHHSYRQAVRALDDIFYRGAGRVVYFNELGSYRRIGEYPYAQERELFERARAEEGDAEKAVDDFYASLLEAGPLDRSNVDELTIRLLVGLEQRAHAEAEGEGVLRSLPSCDLLSIARMETLQDIKKYVTGLLRTWLEGSSFGPRDRQSVVIKQTIEYMKRDFEGATLHNTAEKVHMTPTYLSALFKSSTGKTFIEQLTDIRIEKAKQMLKGTCLKNYEVAEKVGYKDPRYFSQIFKKKVGLSPSEYRESAAI